MDDRGLTAVDSFFVNIWIAGDFDQARQVCREYCFEVGLCVTITPTSFIYTGGEEVGVCVRLINYPRFPSKPDDIRATALSLARKLKERLCQHSFTLEDSGRTLWLSDRNLERAT